MDTNALTTLGLLVAWGADEALEEAPLDRLAPEPAIPPALPPVPAALPRPPFGGLAAPSAERAQAAAAAAGNLAELRAAIAAFEGIGLRDTATGPVLFEGPADAGLLVIGPPPSADDDRAGRPLTGAPGVFFDAMLASIGLSRERLLLTPLIPWRPPGDRPPSPAELATCLPFLHRLIVICSPRTALLLGPLAARALLGAGRRLPKGRLTNAQIPGRDTPLACLPLATPAQVRADPDLRPAIWAELRMLRRHVLEGITQT
ncbi:MAG TPA: uracil-DNA glycosylase [Acetobacteraceae bacterium]|nr:uracil-DNA glycosylase [Acetobacteraceae bacterium]